MAVHSCPGRDFFDVMSACVIRSRAGSSETFTKLAADAAKIARSMPHDRRQVGRGSRSHQRCWLSFFLFLADIISPYQLVYTHRQQDAEGVSIALEQAMIKFFLFLIVAMTAASSVGYAQDSRTAGHKGTAQQQRACRPDVLRLCRGIHDDDAVFECLRANTAKLHSACREVIEAGR
jgi:hypothetical protein